MKSLGSGTICELIMVFFITGGACKREPGNSYYPVAPQDDIAVYFRSPPFTVHADGVRDDSEALQQAVNTVEENHGYGIVFVPPGRYCIKETIYLWKGIRLIGYGAERPVFVLPENSPGYSGDSVKYMVHFCDIRPAEGQPVVDAKNSTFYSGISNIDLEIQPGNPSAVGVRFRVAQLSSLEHIDFRLESGIAAVENVGNEIEDCSFSGGVYGIKTMITSPSWQFLLLDCIFEGQEKAAILTHEAGMTIIRTRFKDAPHAVMIEPDKIEKLYLENCVCEDIHHSVFLISKHEMAENQVNMKNVACRNCPVFLAFRKQDERVEGTAESYVMKSLVHGLVIDAKGDTIRRQIKTVYDMQDWLQEPVVPEKDFPDLPPVQQWVNVKQYGARGDGISDDTEALQKAMTEQDFLYFPMGRYMISNTLTLRQKTCLIGLHPRATHVAIGSPQEGFDKRDHPMPMLIAPHGGRNIISGLGFDSRDNPGAIDVKWMAGKGSYMDDVWFDWRIKADQIPGNGQYPSLWITGGGGGVFKNIWNVNPHKKIGLRIDHTTIEGKIYLMSVEHHTEEEVRMNGVQNWMIYDLQTEERPGNEKTLSTHLLNCENIGFVNLFLYRSRNMTVQHPCGLKLDSCRNIMIRGAHTFSWGEMPYDNTICIKDREILIPDKEFACFHW